MRVELRIGGANRSGDPVAEPTPTAAEKTALCDDDTGAGLASTDGTVEDALTAAGVTDTIIRGLGAVMDSAGYGFDNRATTFVERQGFAAIVMDDCRESATGHTAWDEIIDLDITRGTPTSASRELNGYLRDTYCPAPTLAAPTTPRLDLVPRRQGGHRHVQPVDRSPGRGQADTPHQPRDTGPTDGLE